MIKLKNNEKKLAIVGLVASLVIGGLKGRQVYTITDNIPIAPGNPYRLSRDEWKNVLVETMKALGSKNLPSLAAGVAYYSTLALFPMLAAAVAIAALLITPDQIDAIILTARAYLPADISSVLGSQFQNLVSNRSDNVLAAVIAIAIALFGASGASKNLVIASNVAFGVKETRGWLAQQAWGVIWTVVGIMFGFLSVALLTLNNSFLLYLGVSSFLIPWVLYGRWFLMLLLTILGLSIFYKYGPNRPRVRWQWVSWGAVIATIAWLIATLLFFLYVQYFANYTQSYSLFAGIIVLMIWMNLSALIVLLGAEINHRLESAGHKKWGSS